MEVVGAGRFVEVAADRVEAALRRALERGGRASLALSGGSTPGPIYRALSRRELPWDRVDVFLVDERAVPPDHDDSNGRLARETLTDGAGAPFHPMPADDADPEGAAARYADALPERLDVVVLGIGEDGHTASLFPDGTDWTGAEARVLITASPRHPHRRMTLGPRALAEADTLLMLVAGAAKRDAVAAALEDGPVREVPARLARRARWVLREDAAPEGVG